MTGAYDAGMHEELVEIRHALSVCTSDRNVLCNGDANQMNDE